MKSLKQKFASFMAGRYGADQLYVALLILWGVLTFLQILFPSVLLSVCGLALVIWMFFRCFSRNIEKRRKENAVFLRLWKPVKQWGILQHDRFRDRKTARYRKCKACHAILKLPNEKGKHTVTCPKCHKRFQVRLF